MITLVFLFQSTQLCAEFYYYFSVAKFQNENITYLCDVPKVSVTFIWYLWFQSFMYNMSILGQATINNRAKVFCVVIG